MNHDMRKYIYIPAARALAREKTTAILESIAAHTVYGPEVPGVISTADATRIVKERMRELSKEIGGLAAGS